MESLFVQVTVVPAATSSSSGLNALVPNVDAPMGIVIDDGSAGVTGAGVGVGVGVGVGAE